MYLRVSIVSGHSGYPWLPLSFVFKRGNRKLIVVGRLAQKIEASRMRSCRHLLAKEDYLNLVGQRHSSALREVLMHRSQSSDATRWQERTDF